MTSEDLVRAIIWIGLFVLLCGPVHECAHAFTAWKLGDGTAKLFGRVTLNPIAHLDPLGAGLLAFSVLFAPFGFGWAKPTPVNPYNLRGRYADTMVAAAGPLSNLALAAIFGIAFRVSTSFGYDLYPYEHTGLGVLNYALWAGINLNVALMIFNLIPIPPLDGSHVLYDVLDRRTAMQIRPYLDQYGMFLLILLIIPLGSQSILSGILDSIGVPLIKLLAGL